MTPLDPARPLWQFQLVEDYEGGSAMIARVHHCIGDGIALISVMMSITDGGSDPPTRRRREKQALREHGTDGDWLARAVLEPVTDFTVKALGMYGSGADEVAGLAVRPAVDGGTAELAAWAYQVVSDVAALALMPDDSPTLLKANPRPQGRGLERADAAGPRQGGRQGPGLLGQRRAAVLRRRRHRRATWRAGRRPRGQGDPRHGAGQPAPARPGLEARQPLRPGAAGAADRHRQPDRARLRGAPRA
jgi:hypothetical protein